MVFFCFTAHKWSRGAVILIYFAHSHNILSEEHRLYNMMHNLWLVFKFRNSGEFGNLKLFQLLNRIVNVVSITWDGLAADGIFNVLVRYIESWILPSLHYSFPLLRMGKGTELPTLKPWSPLALERRCLVYDWCRISAVTTEKIAEKFSAKFFYNMLCLFLEV